MNEEIKKDLKNLSKSDFVNKYYIKKEELIDWFEFNKTPPLTEPQDSKIMMKNRIKEEAFRIVKEVFLKEFIEDIK